MRLTTIRARVDGFHPPDDFIETARVAQEDAQLFSPAGFSGRAHGVDRDARNAEEAVQTGLLTS